MAEQRAAQCWIIKVNGAEQVCVNAGEDVEIGRRPLRPLPEDGHKRLEIEDKTRSMSKRHAVFAVAQDGSAELTDMKSTNGSYRVNESGNLEPVKPGVAFSLPSSSERFQFGDVPVDFDRTDKPEGEDGPTKVADLFNNASLTAKQEPDMSDMSVDDILNLRAGEPTRAFNASEVAKRLKQNAKAQAKANEEADQADQALAAAAAKKIDTVEGISVNVTAPGAAQNGERDLFRDAMAAASSDELRVTSTGSNVQSVSEHASAPEQTQSASAQSVEHHPRHQRAEQQTEESVSQQQGAAQPTDGQTIAADVKAQQPSSEQPQTAVQNSNTQQQAAASQEQSQPVQVSRGPKEEDSHNPPTQQIKRVDAPEQAQNSAVAASAAQTAGQSAQAKPETKKHESAEESRPQPKFDWSESDDFPEVKQSVATRPSTRRPAAQQAAAAAQPAQTAGKQDSGASSPVAAEAQQGEATAVFEPGSIFDKVHKGEFDKAAQVIEVNGLTSEDAKKTTDYAIQFEMAKHQPLLPFLAMNPSLYDDLYVWLESQANQEIDASLSRNPGYAKYRESVGGGFAG